MANKPFVYYQNIVESKSYYDESLKRKRYFIKGYSATGDLDLVNDIVTNNCLNHMGGQFENRNIKLDLDHETLLKTKGGDSDDSKLNLVREPLGKAVSYSVDSKGCMVEWELNPNYVKVDSKGDIVKTFGQVWDSIQEKYYDAFSIAYIPTKASYKMVGDKQVRMLDELNLINVGLTGNPINPETSMVSVMAKSLKWLKDNSGCVNRKGYEKDGAHAHTENSPLGEHNHPELERVLESIWDRLYDLERREPDKSPTSFDGKAIKEKGDITMAEKENKPAQEQVQPSSEAENKPESQQEGSSEAQPESSPSSPASDSAEGKSVDMKAFAEFKSQIVNIGSELKNNTEAIAEINKVLAKAIPSGRGAERADVKAETKGQDNILDFI